MLSNIGGDLSRFFPEGEDQEFTSGEIRLRRGDVVEVVYDHGKTCTVRPIHHLDSLFNVSAISLRPTKRLTTIGDNTIGRPLVIWGKLAEQTARKEGWGLVNMCGIVSIQASELCRRTYSWTDTGLARMSKQGNSSLTTEITKKALTGSMIHILALYLAGRDCRGMCIVPNQMLQDPCALPPVRLIF